MRLHKINLIAKERPAAKARVYFLNNHDQIPLGTTKAAEIAMYRAELPRVLQRAGLSPKLADDARFSMRAGCSCGCSPGFILSDFDAEYDVFVTV